MKEEIIIVKQTNKRKPLESLVCGLDPFPHCGLSKSVFVYIHIIEKNGMLGCLISRAVKG